MATDDEHIEANWPQLAALERTLDRIDGRTVTVGKNDVKASAADMRDLLRTARTRSPR